MPKFSVRFFTNAEALVEVEAEEEADAYDLAIEELPDIPYFSGVYSDGWEFADIEEVEE